MYARIASVQVKQAVSGLDALLLPAAQEPNLPVLMAREGMSNEKQQ
jgi:hypothetical protein